MNMQNDDGLIVELLYKILSLASKIYFSIHVKYVNNKNRCLDKTFFYSIAIFGKCIFTDS